MAEYTMTLVDLALKVHREKSNVLPVILSHELETGFKVLLHIANNDQEWLAEANSYTGATKTELKKAAIYFIELYAFKDHKDPYQILGLTPLTPQSEVKAHYRLMMRLFHPDRTTLSLKRARDYAAMINQALDMIQQKNRKEAPLSSSRHIRTTPFIGISNDRRNRFKPDSSFTKSVRSIILNYSLFFLAIILGISLYLTKSQPKTQLEESPSSKEKVNALSLYGDEALHDIENKNKNLLPKSEQVSEAERVVDTSIKASEADNLIIESKASLPLSPPKSIVKKRTIEKIREPIEQKPYVAETQMINQQALKSQAQDQRVEERLAEIEKPIENKPIEKTFSLQDMRNLTYSFVGAYNEGKLDALMQLISDDIKTDAMLSKPELKMAYAKVFANNLKREMILRNLQFVTSSSSIKAKTHYQVKLFENNRNEPKMIFGELEIEGALDHGVPRIITLNNRSLP